MDAVPASLVRVAFVPLVRVGLVPFVRAAFVLALVGCGRVGFDAPSPDDALGEWSAPMPIPTASRIGVNEQDCTMSSSKLEVYFVVDTDLFVVTRPSTASPWSTPSMVSISSADEEGGARLSPDDLAIYFASNRPGGSGSQDVWTATRPSIGAAWSTPTNLVEANTANLEKWFSPCSDGRYVVVRTVGTTMGDIYEGTLGGAAATIVPQLNSSAIETGTHLSNDCSTLFFSSTRDGGHDIFEAHRNADGTWGTPIRADFVSSPVEEEDPWMSADRRLFLFARGVGDDKDLYEMTR